MILDFTLTLNFGDLGEHDVDFSVSYAPGTRDVMYLSNGDPGYPGDPAEVVVLSARIGATEITALLPEDDDLYDKLLAKAAEEARDEDGQEAYEREPE